MALDNTNSAKNISIFSVGSLSTTVIALSDIWCKDPELKQSIALVCPLIMGGVVYYMAKFLAKTEPYTSEQLSKISKINSEINELRIEQKKSKGNQAFCETLDKEITNLIKARIKASTE